MQNCEKFALNLLASVRRDFLVINVTSPNISVTEIIPDRPLAYFSVQDCAEIMEICVQLRSIQLTQNWENITLSIKASFGRFLAINVTSPNIAVSQTMPDRPLAYNSPSGCAVIMEILRSYGVNIAIAELGRICIEYIGIIETISGDKCDITFDPCVTSYT